MSPGVYDLSSAEALDFLEPDIRDGLLTMLGGGGGGRLEKRLRRREGARVEEGGRGQETRQDRVRERRRDDAGREGRGTGATRAGRGCVGGRPRGGEGMACLRYSVFSEGAEAERERQSSRDETTE